MNQGDITECKESLPVDVEKDIGLAGCDILRNIGIEFFSVLSDNLVLQKG